MNRNENDFSNIVDRIVGDFLIEIIKMCEYGPYRKSHKISRSFPMLKLANDEFYEYAFYERRLDWKVRDSLINPFFSNAFEAHNITCLWPDTPLLAGFTTEAFESNYPLEFIIIMKDMRIGVRYTALYGDDLLDCCDAYNLDKVIYIKWENDKKKRQDESTSKYITMSLREFIEQYLDKKDYKLFIDKVLPAIELANKEIGFETIPNLSLKNLSVLKHDIVLNLYNEEYDKLRYIMPPNTKCQEELDKLILSVDDYMEIDKHYIEEGLCKALVGKESFAKCFITAEYQYSIFKEGNAFDYTSVVCGYLKFIEQLIYRLIKIRLEHSTKEELWIKCKPIYKGTYSRLLKENAIRKDPVRNKGNQVKFSKEYEKYFDITLRPLICFIDDDYNGWNISDKGRNVVIELLNNYADEYRNDHFHKDNIDDYDTVKSIRNNTILIAYILLGGYKITTELNKNRHLLGVVDDRFNVLYRKIQSIPTGVAKFIIYKENNDPVKTYRSFVQDSPVYDENGFLNMSTIKFIAVDRFNAEEYDKAMQGQYENKAIYVRYDNIPKRISYINGNGEEVFIEY